MDHNEIESEILRLVNNAEGDNRAILLLIYRMHQELITTNRELTQNTIVTRQVAQSSEAHAKLLQQHALDEMGWISQLKGGWKAGTYSIGIIGLLVTVILGGVQWFAMREITMMQTQIFSNTGRLYVVEREVGVLQDQMGSVRGAMGLHNGAK